MKSFKSWILYLCLILNSTILWADDSQSFKTALLSFDQFERELQKIFSSNASYCQLDSPTSNKVCSFENMCKDFANNFDLPYLVNNPPDEVIVNEQYFHEQELLSACLKAKYQGDIKKAVENFSQEKKAKHLKEVSEINFKLKLSLATHLEFLKYPKIKKEMLKLSNDQNNNLTFGEKLILAQKNAKVNLSKETIALLVKLDEKISDESYLRESEAFEQQLFETPKSKSLFSNLDSFTDEWTAGSQEQLLKNQNIYNQKTKDVYQTFTDAKLKMIELLESKKDGNNDLKIDRMIERIKLTNFRIPVLADDFKQKCAYPNAWFSPSENTVTVCPGWFDRPKLNLFETIAHELSHAIDPCNYNAPFKVKSTSAIMVEEGPFEVNLETEELKSSEIKIGQTDNKGLKNSDQKADILSNHPFLGAISCLMGADSIGAEAPNLNRIKVEAAERLKQLMQENPDYEYDPTYPLLKSAANDFDKYSNSYGLCFLPIEGGNSQLEEAFADNLAFDVVALKLKSIPKEKRVSEIRKMIMSDMNTEDAVCESGPNITKIKEQRKKMGCFSQDQEEMNRLRLSHDVMLSTHFRMESHPKMKDRINKIYFSNPAILNELGCTNNGVKHCEN